MPRPARKEEEEEDGRVKGEEGEDEEEEAARRVKPSKKMVRMPAWEEKDQEEKGLYIEEMTSTAPSSPSLFSLSVTSLFILPSLPPSLPPSPGPHLGQATGSPTRSRRTSAESPAPRRGGRRGEGGRGGSLPVCLRR